MMSACREILKTMRGVKFVEIREEDVGGDEKFRSCEGCEVIGLE